MRRFWLGGLLLAASCASGPPFDVALDSCGPEQAEGTVTNTGDSVAEAEITVTWYDADGVVVYTGQGWSQALPPGATGRWHSFNVGHIGRESAEMDCEVVEVVEFEMPQRG